MSQPRENGMDNTRSYVPITKGTMISRYKIIEKIGAGGMGEVYLAEDTELNRKVALKFLPPHLCQDEDCRARFKREAQAAAKLNHPNIVTIYEVSDYQGRPYFSMEHIEGRSLGDVIKKSELSISEIVDLAIGICEGLNKAHQAGIIHRDIKPSNIVLDADGRPRLLDFGLAAIRGSEKLTISGSTLGTIGYMSPEQVQGKEIDYRSDLFSLGVVLYEIITRQNPFKRDSEAATLKAVSDDLPEPMARFKSGLPDGFQQFIDKALEKDVKIRYQHADGMLADLMRIKRSLDSEQSTVSAALPVRRSMRTRWAAGALVVVVVAVALLLWRPWDQTPVTDDIPMIAVLPFENLGPPEDEYFADGMTEEITSRLAGIQGLGVISRTSAIKYKNADMQLSEIGKELGVAYILEGTVRWSKDREHSRVRITPQLIRVSDDRHLWADNYERELMEVFAVQADIAGQIVEKLGVTLLEKDRRSLSTRPTENAEAYKFYLRGVDLLRRMELRQQPLVEAVEMFDSAVALDPNFARAYAYKSVAQTVCYFQMFGDVSKLAENARQDAEKALSLEPDLAYAHLALGLYYNFVRRDYTRAMEELSQARSELYNNPDLFMVIGLVQMRQGRFDEAIDNFQRAAELDPLNPTRHRILATGLLYNQQYEQAEWAIDQAIWLDRTRPDFYADKIFLYASRYGDLEKMRQVVDDAKEYVNPIAITLAQKWSFKIFDIPDDSLLSYVTGASVGSVPPYQYYSILASIHFRSGRPEVAASYTDSAKVTLEMIIKQVPDDAQLHGALSFALAHLGQHDAAIEEAQRAKELMSVDDCHW